MTEPATPIDAVVVNYNSGDDAARLLLQLDTQRGVDLRIVVIDSASSDDSLAKARSAAQDLSREVRFIEPGRNVGYTGNNLAFTHGRDVFIVNPDVRLEAPDVLATLSAELHADEGIAAVAPTIDVDGCIEYADSVVDLKRAQAHHSLTHLRRWPHAAPQHEISWLNGAAWLLRAEALRQVGPLDERFFLFFEEVDWCLRARTAGWRLLLVNTVRVGHRRSSSFTGSKGAFYYWRNLHLLCEKHGTHWRAAYLRRLVGASLSRRALRRGEVPRALQGYVAARRGQYGPAPEDR